MKKSIYSITFSVLIIFTACSKSENVPAPTPIDPCLGVTISPSANVTHTTTGLTQGTITVTSPVGSGLTYSIGGTFQSSTNFFNLAAGNYTLTVKNASNCSGALALTINGYGPKYYEVKNIIAGYCGPCHLSGGIQGGKNFDQDNSIVNSWDRIKIRAVDGNPSFMPQNGQLTAIDKQKIVDWVNAGHRITD